MNSSQATFKPPNPIIPILMADYYPLANCANVLCSSVDVLVASCNKMAPITVSV